MEVVVKNIRRLIPNVAAPFHQSMRQVRVGVTKAERFRTCLWGDDTVKKRRSTYCLLYTSPSPRDSTSS
eukprot:9356000-Prorocentrum_lima.AAC.1